MKHAAIIPLIGGELLASMKAFETPPSYILSFSSFLSNEQHLIFYLKEKGIDIPYSVLDKNQYILSSKEYQSMDVISTVCPCAGLSTYHFSFGEKNQNNQWLEKTTKIVLEECKPKVFWGENSPMLATNTGEFIREKMKKIGQDAGYNMTIYVTKSLLHGTPQIRRRSFYFFWKKDFFDNSVPIFNYYNTPYETITDLILNVKMNSQRELIDDAVPSEKDPYYKYLLELEGKNHREFASSLTKKTCEGSLNVEMNLVLDRKITYKQIIPWLEKNNYLKFIDRAKRRHEKLSKNQNVMWRGTIIPYEYIGAYVVHMPYNLVHPREDRYCDFREAMTIMGLPEDFILIDPHKNLNHVCQNVPFKTAYDMAVEVKNSIEMKRSFEKVKYLVQSNLNKTISREQENLEEFFT